MRRACFCNDRRNDLGCQLSGDQNFPGGVIPEIGKWKISRSEFVQAPRDPHGNNLTRECHLVFGHPLLCVRPFVADDVQSTNAEMKGRRSSPRSL